MRKIVNPPPLHFSLFDDNCLWPIHKLSDFICSVWWKLFTPNLKSTSSHLLPLFRRDKKFFLNIPWPISTERGKNILDIQVGRSFLISGRRMQCKQEAIIGQGNPGNQLHPQLYLCIWLPFTCIQLCMFPYGYISHVNICKIASSCVFADVHSHMYICKNTYVCNISVNCMHIHVYIDKLTPICVFAYCVLHLLSVCTLIHL